MSIEYAGIVEYFGTGIYPSVKSAEMTSLASKSEQIKAEKGILVLTHRPARDDRS
jgi:hypothetical protein